jgi:hypothetical protein
MHAAYFGDHRPTDLAPLKTYGIARLVIIGNILLGKTTNVSRPSYNDSKVYDCFDFRIANRGTAGLSDICLYAH